LRISVALVASMPIFGGTEKETLDLLAATEHSCTPPDQCVKNAAGAVVQMCSAHRALLDQKFLDGVLKWRRRREYLWEGENHG